MRHSRLQPSRLALLALCLALALALVGALGWEAITASRAQRRAVEEVLSDYAALAAEQYARNVNVTLEYELILPMFRALPGMLEEGAGVRADAQVQGQRHSYALAETVDALFSIDRDGAVAALDGRGAAMEFAAADALKAHAEELAGGDSPYVAAWDIPWSVDGLVVYRHGDTDSTQLMGFVTPTEVVQRFLEDAVGIYDLLPPSLTDGNGDDLVHVRVLDAAGNSLFSSGPQGDHAIQATFDLPPHLAELSVVTSIPESSADRLVVGGLPYSRLPAVVGMLLVTLMLLAFGAVLWRRERDLMNLREDFVAGASHELRTPLAQIRMFAETLRLDRVRSAEEQQRSIEIIDREARRLSLLVENLLQFSTGARRPPRAALQATDVQALIADVVEGFEPLATGRSATVVVDVDEPLEADLDRDLMKQVLVNLLDNAVKYGPEAQTIRVAAGSRGDGIEISVADQGPGIPATEREAIWQRFWRGERTDGVTGTGIGLALVFELVHLHNGTVAVEDADGGGARFVVRLPKGGR